MNTKTLRTSLHRRIRTAFQGAIAGLSLFAASQAFGANRTLVLLQQNSGRTALDDILPAPLRTVVRGLLDQGAETTESDRFDRLASGRYQKFVNLTDWRCNRAALLETLMQETDAGATVDLVVLGHGTTEELSLYGSETLSGATPGRTGNIRSLLNEARRSRWSDSYRFNLRLVYMCNCRASTVTDDWLAIGAQTAVGSLRNNYMPEPMITRFWNDFVTGDMSVAQAAEDSLATAKLFFSAVPGFNSVDAECGLTRFQEAEQIVRGNRNLIFNDQYQLGVNHSRTVTVAANREYTFPGVYLVEGQSYRIQAAGTWRNSGAAGMVDADGYSSASILDSTRRSGKHSPMRLLGERFRHNSETSLASYIGGSVLNIGTGKSFTAGGSGFLNLFANDSFGAYRDNAGHVTVTITRTR